MKIFLKVFFISSKSVILKKFVHFVIFSVISRTNADIRLEKEHKETLLAKHGAKIT